jgi:hypothetical protein
MPVKTYSRNNNGSKKLAPNFIVREFASKCGADKILIDDRLPHVLQHMRTLLGNRSLSVNSGYRTPEHNKRIGGATNSFHLRGMAADISQHGTDLVTMCRAAESALLKYKIPGCIILYTRSKFVHVDVRPTRWRGQDDGDGRGARTVSAWSPLETAVQMSGGVIPPANSQSFQPYRVRVSVAGLNVRQAPGTNSPVISVIRDRGVYTVLYEADGIGASKWGRIEDGWISLDFVVRV